MFAVYFVDDHLQLLERSLTCVPLSAMVSSSFCWLSQGLLLAVKAVQLCSLRAGSHNPGWQQSQRVEEYYRKDAVCGWHYK